VGRALYKLVSVRFIRETLEVPHEGSPTSNETIIAEKFQAMTVLGMANSRMKDFYDI
jgi:hypothetical protein